MSFNYLHARGRVKIENTIGLLKCKFKINGTTMRQKKLITIVELVKSTICIHNFLINYNLNNHIDEEDDENIDDTNNEFVENFAQHRPINSRLRLNAHNRREAMKNTNI